MDKTKTSKVVAIVEARMGSSRLPGKVLADIQGKPALMRLISRLRFCKELDEIVVATSTSPKDDSLAEWLQNNSVKFYRGSEEDVLQRLLDSAKKFNYKFCYLESASQLKTALTLYEKNGFEHLDTPRGYTGHTICGIYMLKKLI